MGQLGRFGLGYEIASKRIFLRKATSAFTLVEVLVATSLLAIGLLGALTALSTASRVAGASTNDTTITLLAQEKLAEIQLLGADIVALDEAEGDFAPTHPDYGWRMIVESPDDRNVIRVDLFILAPEAGRTREVRFFTNVF